MTEKDKKVKIIFGIRAVFWVIALGATIHWIYWSFKLYDLGILDVYEYAKYFRPIFGKDLLISVGAICISLLLRRISDKIKETIKHSEE